MIRKREQGVSPIVGLLLLLGLSITLFAFATDIFFSTLSVSASPQAELDITHTYGSGAKADVSIRIVRNLNVENLQYFIEDENNNQVTSTKSFDSNDPGHIENIDGTGGGPTTIKEDYTVVVIGSVGSGSFVLNTYTIPQESI